MRVSIGQFVEEIAGHAGTLCAVLSENTVCFPITGMSICMDSTSIRIEDDYKLFSLPVLQIHSIEKTFCNAFTDDARAWIEYEVSTVQGGTITIDIH